MNPEKGIVPKLKVLFFAILVSGLSGVIGIMGGIVTFSVVTFLADKILDLFDYRSRPHLPDMAYIWPSVLMFFVLLFWIAKVCKKLWPRDSKIQEISPWRVTFGGTLGFLGFGIFGPFSRGSIIPTTAYFGLAAGIFAGAMLSGPLVSHRKDRRTTDV